MLYRLSGDVVEVLIAHMGGPFWAKKDHGAWSIPKGEYGDGDDPRAAAAREFEEELGSPVPAPADAFIPLGHVTQSGGKVVTAWAVQGDFDTTTATSNTFTMEWPKGSGRLATFPEIDRAAWCDLPTARAKLVKGQLPFLDRLHEVVRDAHPEIAGGEFTRDG